MSKHTEKKNSSLNVGGVIAQTESFIEKNQKILIIIIAAILVVVLGVFGFHRFYLQPKEARASEAIFPAQHWFEMDSVDLALNGNATHSGFIAVIDEYGSTKVGNLAKYYAGLCYLKKGEYQNAIDYLKKYKGKDIITSQMVLVNIGDAYLELGDNAKAASEYEKAAKLNANEMVTPYALFKAGIAYEMQKDMTNALKMYNRIKSEFPFSTEYREIDKYIAHAEGMNKK